MKTSNLTLATPSSLCGFRLALCILLLTVAPTVFAQRRVSADVETKQVYAGKVLTTTKSVYCSNNGRVVVVFHSPKRYTLVTDLKGESRIFLPESNRVFVDTEGTFSSKDELITLFLRGRVDDLGLEQYGYRLSSAKMEDGYLKKTYHTFEQGSTVPDVEIVFENYLPIYLAYINDRGETVSKTYFSRYENFNGFALACRVTEIAYTAKGDSTITRSVYSNVKIDPQSEWFDFEVPSDAETMSSSEVMRQIEAMKK